MNSVKFWIFSGFSCKNSMKMCAFNVITKMGASLTRLNIIKLRYSDKFKRLVCRWILAWVILINKTSNSKQKSFFLMWNIGAFSYHKNADKNEFLITRTVKRTRTCKILILTVSFTRTASVLLTLRNYMQQKRKYK